MKSSTISSIADLPRLQRHAAKDRFAAHPQFSQSSMHNHDTQNSGNITIQAQQAGRDKAPINSLWIIKIGNRVVGMARLIQDGPRSAQIVLFRIDPEWSHTKVPVNLIYSIQSFCQNHGGLKVSMQPHSAPPWLLTLMNHHGFEFSKAKA